MAVPMEEMDRLVRLLSRDVANTLGPGHTGTIIAEARRLQPEFDDAAEYVSMVVENVQQDLQCGWVDGSWIDVSWPSCPRHPNHPLWFEDGWWWCKGDRVAIVELGGLEHATS